MTFDSLFPRGDENGAFAQYFIGQSYLAPLASLGMSISNVTFEPGCRNNWHRHNATSGGGQILLATAGSGWYQAEGEEPVSLTPGTVVEIPAGTKHWHGAKADSWFSHVAIAVPGDPGHLDRVVGWVDASTPSFHPRRTPSRTVRGAPTRRSPRRGPRASPRGRGRRPSRAGS